MGFAKHLNYSKYGLRFKLSILGLLLFLTWDVNLGLFRLLNFPFLSTEPKVGAKNGTLWEWYFRSTLDHWSTFLGMIFAANYPIVSLFLRKLEALPSYKCYLGKAAIAITLLAAFAIWLHGPFQADKLTYNSTNCYFGFIPLITYIYLRNLNPTLRSYSLQLLHEIGKTTLETYLLQHHIWLTSNAKSLLTLLPGWPKVNMLLVTYIFFYTSRRVYKITLILRGMLLPNDNAAQCIKSLLVIASTIAIFYALAFFLDGAGNLSLTIVGIVSIICGMLLYQTVMDSTWKSYRESASRLHDMTHKNKVLDESGLLRSVSKGGHHSKVESSVSKIIPPIIGTMVVLILGLFWQGMAISGAGKIQPLPQHCHSFANRGLWVPVDGCNDVSRGAAFRDYKIANIATCAPMGGGYIWGWKHTKRNSHCRFQRRDFKQLATILQDRRVAFIGDSMTRNLYHSFCRQMGIEDAGGFDVTGPKHTDIHRTIQRTGLEFKWAPLATNLLEQLRDMNPDMTQSSSSSQQQNLSKYDLIVMGGGAWDQLHVFATDEDQESLRATLRLLSKEITNIQKALDIPIVWLVPTTINTPALNTEDKRDHMTEDDMTQMRGEYINAGVLASSSFVIDGPSFTKSRAQESYDGVHYPHVIYDAGAQILANSLDWLLPTKKTMDPFTPPEVGTMANPYLGLMMLCFSFIGLIFFDGYLGFSYAACIFIKGILPHDLYHEAFETLHRKARLPDIGPANASSNGSVFSFMTQGTIITHGTQGSHGTTPSLHNRTQDISKRFSGGAAGNPERGTGVDEEIAALLADDAGEETELTSMK
eukprot:CAMPEP_0184870608 /NCGR_PEP_ID=MMETSP0580-20130426/38092_1 /TAXON_ID=1118495 /ORGANISM="Dactyliosolen fragilissimus" /LENGTH=814 /DNA_ID=CAMNT_0027372773 /DNA_START=141 /DNA_END=2585 /DNA_ORIENTATION=+